VCKFSLFLIEKLFLGVLGNETPLLYHSCAIASCTPIAIAWHPQAVVERQLLSAALLLVDRASASRSQCDSARQSLGSTHYCMRARSPGSVPLPSWRRACKTAGVRPPARQQLQRQQPQRRSATPKNDPHHLHRRSQAPTRFRRYSRSPWRQRQTSRSVEAKTPTCSPMDAGRCCSQGHAYPQSRARFAQGRLATKWPLVLLSRTLMVPMDLVGSMPNGDKRGRRLPRR
jgi:hypothetical protein